MQTGRLIVSLFALGLTASCTVVVDDNSPPPRPGPPGYCTRNFDPVCAARPGDRQTFPNACVAESRGYRILHPGECRRTGGIEPDDAVICPQIYAPVCARQGSNLRTFPNECQARGSGFNVVGDGPC